MSQQNCQDQSYRTTTFHFILFLLTYDGAVFLDYCNNVYTHAMFLQFLGLPFYARSQPTTCPAFFTCFFVTATAQRLKCSHNVALIVLQWLLTFRNGQVAQRHQGSLFFLRLIDCWAVIPNAPKPKPVLPCTAKTTTYTGLKICVCSVLIQRSDHKAFSKPSLVYFHAIKKHEILHEIICNRMTSLKDLTHSVMQLTQTNVSQD